MNERQNEKQKKGHVLQLLQLHNLFLKLLCEHWRRGPLYNALGHMNAIFILTAFHYLGLHTVTVFTKIIFEKCKN